LILELKTVNPDQSTTKIHFTILATYEFWCTDEAPGRLSESLVTKI